MIAITVYRSPQGGIHGFSTEGHAESAPQGQDIVCAAVSAIVQTAVFGLYEVAGFTMECALEPDTGRVTRTLPRGLAGANREAYQKAQAILAAMAVGLRSTAGNHQEYVTYREEEIQDV